MCTTSFSPFHKNTTYHVSSLLILIKMCPYFVINNRQSFLNISGCVCVCFNSNIEYLFVKILSGYLVINIFGITDIIKCYTIIE